jgi:hypothetical protein
MEQGGYHASFHQGSVLLILLLKLRLPAGQMGESGNLKQAMLLAEVGSVEYKNI